MKRLILNADDFCLSPVFNAAIIELAREGAISSVSAMVDRFDSSQQEQVESLLKTSVGIGLHVEFATSEAYADEVQRQYDLFKRIFGREPSHIDIHKSDHMELGYPIIVQFARESGATLTPTSEHLF